MNVALAAPRPLWQRYVAVLFYLMAVFVIVQLAGLIILSLDKSGALKSGKTMEFRVLIFGVVIQLVGFLLPAPLLLKFTRAYNYTFAKARPVDILLCCGLIFLSLIFFSVLYTIIGVEPKQLAFLDMHDVMRHKIAFIVITGVLVPGYEEWIFRGLIFGVLVTGFERRRDVVLAALFCTVLFTASHIEGKHSLTALPPIMAMAAIFQYMTWKSQSLWPAVCGHAMQNLISVGALIARSATESAR